MDDHVGCGYGSETEIVVSTLPALKLFAVAFSLLSRRTTPFFFFNLIEEGLHAKDIFEPEGTLLLVFDGF
jgi:hypothetical protein